MIHERRDYFRIEDDVLLRCKTVSQSAALANSVPHEFTEAPGYSLMHELRLIEKDSRSLLSAVGEYNRDIEAYLQSLNKKIDTIASHIAASHKPDIELQTMHISLSEGGLSFHSEMQQAHDSYLALQMTFLPSHNSLILFAKVINCTAHKQGGYSVAISFVYLTDADRQQISKYVMQFQVAEKRKLEEDSELDT